MCCSSGRATESVQVTESVQQVCFKKLECYNAGGMFIVWIILGHLTMVHQEGTRLVTIQYTGAYGTCTSVRPVTGKSLCRT